MIEYWSQDIQVGQWKFNDGHNGLKNLARIEKSNLPVSTFVPQIRFSNLRLLIQLSGDF